RAHRAGPAAVGPPPHEPGFHGRGRQGREAGGRSAMSEAVPPAFQDRFDALLERLLDTLPAGVLAVLDEVPLHVMDEPDRLILKDLGVEPADMDDAVEELCGLHTGFMLTERPIELDAVLP